MKIRNSSRDHGNVSRIPEHPAPDLKGDARKVQIGYRPVGGRAVTWTIGLIHGLLKRGTQLPADEEMPDPHYHWCVIVGDYYHQMQITDGLIWYDNDEVSWKDGWSLFDIGETRFNDAAIAEAGIDTIFDMPEAYDLWANNCHHFTLSLVKKICSSGHKSIVSRSRRHRLSSSIRFTEEEEGPEGGEEVVKEEYKVAETGEGRFSVEKLEVASAEDGHDSQHKKTVEKAESIMSEHTPSVTPDGLKMTQAVGYFEEGEAKVEGGY